MNKKKRVVFCTYPCLYSDIVLNEILRAPDIEVVSVVVSTRNLQIKENKLFSDLKRLKESGLRYSLYLLFVTQAYKLFPQIFNEQATLKALCEQHHIPILFTSDINSTEVQAQLQSLDPDIIFCAHFNQRLHPSTYRLARCAAINLHPSLLPDLKGVDPAFYALKENYRVTGVTIHHLAETFDTGEVISQKQQIIEIHDTLLSLNKKLFREGAQLLVKYLSGKEKRDHSSAPKSTGRYDSWPSKESVREFKKYRNFIFLNRLFR
ncbi:hypothetical protein EOL70_16775 [Leucothrix sargassi]|nr:hypothetical protein EOL70_16775 [Leucothrix sargassi]